METFNNIYIIFSLVLVAGFISVFKFIAKEKSQKNISYSSLLIEMINSLHYKKEVLDNDFPEYPGELEKQDTKEYINFLDEGILSKF